MPKNDFISDNLVHMRDRLKENAAKAAVPGAVPSAVREPEPEKPRLSARFSAVAGCTGRFPRREGGRANADTAVSLQTFSGTFFRKK